LDNIYYKICKSSNKLTNMQKMH